MGRESEIFHVFKVQRRSQNDCAHHGSALVLGLKTSAWYCGQGAGFSAAAPQQEVEARRQEPGRRPTLLGEERRNDCGAAARSRQRWRCSAAGLRGERPEPQALVLRMRVS